MSEHGHWVIPEMSGAQYVPDADEVAGIVSALVAAGWIRMAASAPYDATGPFYYATFPGVSDAADGRAGDPRYDLSVAKEPVIRQPHCRTLTVMVTDSLLVAPTTEAQSINIACSRCGKDLLAEAEPDTSRRVSGNCPSCGNGVSLEEFHRLPVFRFALVIELWYPQAHPGLSVDPQLLALLTQHTGCSFREQAQHAQ